VIFAGSADRDGSVAIDDDLFRWRLQLDAIVQVGG
jgi:hypothetical protein